MTFSLRNELLLLSKNFVTVFFLSLIIRLMIKVSFYLLIEVILQFVC